MKKLFLLLILFSPVSLFSMSDEDCAQVIADNYAILIERDNESGALDWEINRIWQELATKFRKEIGDFHSKGEASRLAYDPSDPAGLWFHERAAAFTKQAEDRFRAQCSSLPKLRERILFVRQVDTYYKLKKKSEK